MSQAGGGAGGAYAPQDFGPVLTATPPPRFLVPPLTDRPPRFSDLETCLHKFHFLKFMFSKKATKIEKKFTVNLTLTK